MLFANENKQKNMILSEFIINFAYRFVFFASLTGPNRFKTPQKVRNWNYVA